MTVSFQNVIAKCRRSEILDLVCKRQQFPRPDLGRLAFGDDGDLAVRRVITAHGDDNFKIPFSAGDGRTHGHLFGTGAVDGIDVDTGIYAAAAAEDSRSNSMIEPRTVIIGSQRVARGFYKGKVTVV